MLERADRVGGRTASFTQDGFSPFDYGPDPSYLLSHPPLREIFGACGHDLDDSRSICAASIRCTGCSSTTGNTFDATADVDRLTAEAAADQPRRCPERAALSEREHAPSSTSSSRSCSGPFHGLMDWARMDMLRAFSRCSGPGRRSIRTCGAGSGTKTCASLQFQSKYLGMSPFKCPSLFTIRRACRIRVFGQCSTRSAAATRSPRHRPAWRPGWASDHPLLGPPAEETPFSGAPRNGPCARPRRSMPPMPWW